MIPRSAATSEASGAAERLLGCSLSALPLPSLDRQPFAHRLEQLLEWMVGVAGGSSGVVALPNADGLLLPHAVAGMPTDAARWLPAAPERIEFGLIVHDADLDGDGNADDRPPCACGLGDDDSRMAIRLPLRVNERLLGAVQIGFAALRSLDPAEVRRLGMIADHIASAAEAHRLAQESAARQLEIERVSTMLDELNRMKSDFLSMISHELRTPLTAIIGYTDLLLRQVHGSLTDRQSHHQQAVKKAAHRLLDLVNDLLDVNRLEGGQVALNLQSVSLVDAAKLAVARTVDSASRKGVELRLDTPVATISILADPERVHQVLTNLLDNAVKFTPRGGTVTVRIVQRGDEATVSVVDTGVGVPPDQIERIWDRFHQVDSSTRRQFGGTGLGLAIVRNLVELHGGSVAAASDGPGTGSTFSATFPVTPGPASAAPVSPDAHAPDALAASLPSAGPSRTVLIVDDEPDNREVITSIVQDVLGHTVVAATNGQEALSCAQSLPDLILLDLRMPVMSGFDVARTLKDDPQTASIPIIAITALAAEDDRRDALAAGCIGWVTKPFAEEALASAIESALAPAARSASR